MKKIKIRYYILGTGILFIFIVLFFAASAIKMYAVKNGEKLIGRKVALSELHINYLKISVDIKGFALYESNKTDTFVSFNDLYVNFDPLKLISKEFAFSQIRLVNPYISVIQNDTIFNFSDIIAFFSDTSKPKVEKDTTKSEIRYSVAKFDLKGGKVRYVDKKIDSRFDLNNLNFTLPYIAWDSKNAKMGLNLTIGNGTISIDSKIFPITKNYNLAIETRNLSIEPFTPYIKNFIHINSLNGLLNTKIALNGNYTNFADLVVSGKIDLCSLSITDQKGVAFTNVGNIFLGLDSIDIGRSHYKISKIEISQPHIVADLNKQGSNFEKIFAPKPQIVDDTSTIESIEKSSDKIANQNTSAAPKGTALSYEIDSLILTDGQIDFTDNTLNRPFYYKLLKCNFAMGHFTNSATNIPASFSVILDQSGTIKGKTIFNVVDPLNLNLDLNIKAMDLASFAPYTEYYVARPIIGGQLNYACALRMTPKKLDNKNSVAIDKIEFGKKTKDSTAMKVPVMLGIVILRDVNGNIRFDLPVNGNPSDPKFKYGKIIWQTFVNLMVKAASEPFNAMSNLLGTNPESMKTIDFNFAQDTLGSEQLFKLDKIVTIKSQKPELIYLFTQETGLAKEKGILAVREVKHNYVSSKLGLTDENLIREKINGLNDNDSSFIAFIHSQLLDSATLTTEDACIKIIGEEKANKIIADLIEKRNNLIAAYLATKGFTPDNFNVTTSNLLNLAEQQQTPKFRIEIRMD